jgi:hypothetical protein
MLTAIETLFPEAEFLVVPGWDHLGYRLQEVNACDLVVIGGGGLVLRNTGFYHWAVRELKPPAVALGISIEARHPDNEALIDALLSKCESVVVRDSASASLLGGHRKVVTAPDLTFLIPWPIADEADDDICALNLRDWCWWRLEYRSKLDRGMRRYQAALGWLRNVPFIPSWKPELAVRALQGEFRRILPWSFYSEPGAVGDGAVLRRWFADAGDDFDIETLRSSRYLVSMRFHGLVFACQTGTPFVSLSYQPKNVQFCRDVGLPQASVDLYDLRGLHSALCRLKSEYADTRRHLLEKRAVYTSEAQTVYGEAVSRFV